jgi:peptidyl-prolyl cis-trans isomerase C
MNIKDLNKNVILVAAIVLVVAVGFLFLKTPSGSVIATVNGKKIYDLELKEFLSGQFQVPDNFDFNVIPQEQKSNVILQFLADKKTLKEAYKAGIHKTDKVKETLKKAEEDLIKKEFINEIGEKAATREKIENFYAEYAAKRKVEIKGKDEVKARHILVETREEANRLYYKLKSKGANFADLARKNSLDKASGENGGDIGYFTEGVMAKEFEKIAFQTRPGNVARPFKTKFGWHIVEVQDKRKAQVPALDKVYAKIKQELYVQGVNEFVSEIRENSKIEFPKLESVSDKAAASEDEIKEVPAVK